VQNEKNPQDFFFPNEDTPLLAAGFFIVSPGLNPAVFRRFERSHDVPPPKDGFPGIQLIYVYLLHDSMK
jgi:hypothetical protein